MGNNGQRRAITSRAMVAFKGIPPPLYVSTSGRGDRKVANSRSGLAQPSSQVPEFSGYLVPGQPRLLPKEDSSHRRGGFGFGAGFLLFTPPSREAMAARAMVSSSILPTATSCLLP